MLNKKVKKQWLTALESGKFRQGIGQFAKTDDHRHTKYCCLGVLNKICNLGYEKSGGAFPSSELPFGLTDKQQWDLIEMNDGGESFKEIAQHIRKNL